LFDISGKSPTLRTATARSVLKVSPDTITLIAEGKIPKGDPLPVAKVASIQAAKNTSGIIPYCHPIPVEWVDVRFDIGTRAITTDVTIKSVYKTGVEIEALTAASVAALTLYDMMKMLDDGMEIESVRLVSKIGGKNDFRDTFTTPLKAAVVVVSDSVSSGEKTDKSGAVLAERLKSEGLDVVDFQVIPDDEEKIVETLTKFAEDGLAFVATTGGTGLGERDHTPEAMSKVIEREVPGIAETARSYGQDRMPYAMLSRSIAGVRGNTLFLALPGSTKGVEESLDGLFPALLHALTILSGDEGHEKD